MIILLILPIGLISGSFYNGIISRVSALRATATMLENTFSNPDSARTGLDFWVDRGIEYSGFLNAMFGNIETFQHLSDENVSYVNYLERNLQGYALQCRYFSDLAYKTAQGLVEKELALKESGFEAKGISFENILSISAELANVSQQLQETNDEVFTATELAKNGNATDMRNLSLKGVELANAYYQLSGLTSSAISALAAIEVSVVAPFILVTVLYGIFLLYPWVILFLFFCRKREDILESKAVLINNLNLDDRLRETESSGYDFNPLLIRVEKILHLPLSNQEKTRDASGSKVRKQENDVSAKEDSIARNREIIGNQAFRIREYLVSLILLTSLTAAIFYLFFYPNATAGLANLIANGGGARAFADYLAGEATPLTFGFLGSYFWTIQYFLRRYYASDLNPNAYTSAFVRTLTVFILSVVLQLATSAFGWTQFVMASVAFVIGIFPDVGVRWILRTANKLVTTLRAPEVINENPLTNINGLNTWHEARLLEENIENEQNLATVSLEKLVINTSFCPLQLIDWVDQALLSIHIQGPWKDAFRAVGIRTATDLLDNVKKDQSPNQDDNKNGIQRLVQAINTAQACSSSDLGQSRNETVLAVKDLDNILATAISLSNQTKTIADSLIEDKPETLDFIDDLKKKTQNLEQLSKEISDQELKQIKQKEEKISGNNSNATDKRKKAVKKLEKSAAELADETSKVNQEIQNFDRKKPESMSQIDSTKEIIEKIRLKAENLKTELISVVEIAKQGKKDEDLSEEQKEFIKVLQETQEKSKQMLSQVQVAKEKIESFDPNKPETLSGVEKLKVELNKLNKTAEEAQAKVKKIEESVEKLMENEPSLKKSQDNLRAVAEGINNFEKTSKDAKEATEKLNIDDPKTLTELSQIKKLVDNASKIAAETKTKEDNFRNEVTSSISIPKITEDVLKTIVISVKKGPNIRHLQAYYIKKSKAEEQKKPTQPLET